MHRTWTVFSPSGRHSGPQRSRRLPSAVAEETARHRRSGRGCSARAEASQHPHRCERVRRTSTGRPASLGSGIRPGSTLSPVAPSRCLPSSARQCALYLRAQHAGPDRRPPRPLRLEDKPGQQRLNPHDGCGSGPPRPLIHRAGCRVQPTSFEGASAMTRGSFDRGRAARSGAFAGNSVGNRVARCYKLIMFRAGSGRSSARSHGGFGARHPV